MGPTKVPNATLWEEYNTNHNLETKKKIILQYTNLVYYVIQHSRLVGQNVVSEEDYFQFGVEGLSEAIDRFNPDNGTKFEPYAVQRIRGKIIDELHKIQTKSMVGGKRKKAHNLSLSEPCEGDESYQLYGMLPPDNNAPEQEIEKNELKETILEALKALPERDRLIITLYYYENLSYQEIAEVLDTTVSRISKIHSKVLEQLKQVIIKSN